MIFSLFGWSSIGHGRHTKPGIYVELHNKWNTLCSKEKTKAIEELSRSKYNGVKIFGAIVDKEPKDYYTKKGVRVLSGEHFLRFMLPCHEEIFNLLHSLVEEYNENFLIPYLKH